jgi:protein transport protein SEC24
VDGVQPDVLALDAPPPPIRVPPQASVTQSPYVTCPPEYSRATTNSVPATPSLVKKTRLPLGLLITPCKSLGEGEVRNITLHISIRLTFDMRLGTSTNSE